MKTVEQLSPEQRAIRKYKRWLKQHENAPKSLKVKKFEEYMRLFDA